MIFNCFRHLRLTFSILLMIGCGEKFEPNNPDYGLMKFELTFDSDVLGDLNNSSQAKRPFGAIMNVDGQRHSVRVNYAGKSTLDAVKKSLDLELTDSSFRGRTTLRLSTQFVDKSLLRSIAGFSLYQRFGVMTPFFEPAVVYINNEYKGLFILVEPINDEFFATRHIASKEIFKAKFGNADFSRRFINRLGDAYTRRSKLHRSFSSIATLWEQVLSKDLKGSMEYIDKLVNIDNYLRYIAISVALNNWDGYRNNYFLVRHGKDSKFHILPWDLDRILEAQPYQANASIWGENGLTERLLADPLNRKKYLGYIAEIVSSGYLEQLQDQLVDTRDSIQDAYDADPYLQGFGSIHQSSEELITNLKIWVASLSGELLTLTGPLN